MRPRFRLMPNGMRPTARLCSIGTSRRSLELFEGLGWDCHWDRSEKTGGDLAPGRISHIIKLPSEGEKIASDGEPHRPSGYLWMHDEHIDAAPLPDHAKLILPDGKHVVAGENRPRKAKMTCAVAQ